MAMAHLVKIVILLKCAFMYYLLFPFTFRSLMKESILRASIRSFFVALCGIVGLIIGAALIFLITLGLIFSSEKPDIKYKYNPEIVANAEGERKAESYTSPVILKINIHGVIGMDNLTRKDISQQLIESRERSLEDDRVKAILLSIDSPGGTVVDSDGIYREIKAYKERYNVPVYAYIDGFCASGGYYIANAADKIFASNTSLIGSVGVLLPTIMNVSQLMEKIGVQSITLYDGKGKDNLNPFRPWRKGEEENIQDSINYYYQMFVDIVTESRPSLEKKKLIEDYGANIFPAGIAKKYGFIDENDVTYNSTLELLAKKIGIRDGYYQVIELEHKSWAADLLNSQSQFFSGKVTHHLALPAEMSPELSNQFLFLYRP